MTASTEGRDGQRNGQREGNFLAGRHAIVTGAGRGIGAAIAESLARSGARITLMGRTRETVDRTAQRLRDTCGRESAAIVCDVSDPNSVADAFTVARSEFGAPYILVNNAGQSEAASIEETTEALWAQMLGVNLTGTFLCTKQVIPGMRANQEGRIVNIASTAGLKGYSHTTAYCAAKHGVIGLTRSLAVETAKTGITVNAVCPGYTDTDMAQTAIGNLMRNLGKSEEEARKMLVRGIPRGTLIAPSEVANAVLWLCSPEATAITGQSIAVAGGEVT